MTSRIILGLDGISRKHALALGRKLGSKCYAAKVHDLVDDNGPKIIRELKEYFPRVFLDYKLHDIPKTVHKRAQKWKRHGVDIITVHTSGGGEMITAALDAGITVYGVTVLTSLSDRDCSSLFAREAKQLVLSWGTTAAIRGVHGLVMSPLELELFREKKLYENVEKVTPGVRSEGVPDGDQSRVATPAEAIQNGATKVVVASQIIQANEPILEFERIEREIG